MAKINLLNKIQKRQVQKRIAAKNSVWIIAREQNDTEYYVLKADEDGFAVVWTNNPDKAMRFHTEKGCQHFVQRYMKNRPNVHLKWMVSTEPK